MRALVAVDRLATIPGVGRRGAAEEGGGSGGGSEGGADGSAGGESESESAAESGTDTGAGTGTGNYKTLMTDNGPSHVIVPYAQAVVAQ